MFLLDTVDSFQCIVLNTQIHQCHILISSYGFLLRKICPAMSSLLLMKLSSAPGQIRSLALSSSRLISFNSSNSSLAATGLSAARFCAHSLALTLTWFCSTTWFTSPILRASFPSIIERKRTSSAAHVTYSSNQSFCSAKSRYYPEARFRKTHSCVC